jgi:hypothetical protein
MKLTPHFVAAAFVLTIASTYAQKSLDGTKLDITSIDLSGASSLHRLSVAVDSNNTVSATGVRYDTAPAQISYDPVAGTAVASLPGSGFGTPISTTNIHTFNKSLRDPRTRTNVVVTLTNTYVTTLLPFGIFLDDSSHIKGSLTAESWIKQDARISFSGTPIFTTRSGGQKSSEPVGAIAFGEKTGNFGGESDDD